MVGSLATVSIPARVPPITVGPGKPSEDLLTRPVDGDSEDRHEERGSSKVGA